MNCESNPEHLSVIEQLLTNLPENNAVGFRQVSKEMFAAESDEERHVLGGDNELALCVESKLDGLVRQITSAHNLSRNKFTRSRYRRALEVLDALRKSLQ